MNAIEVVATTLAHSINKVGTGIDGAHGALAKAKLADWAHNASLAFEGVTRDATHECAHGLALNASEICLWSWESRAREQAEKRFGSWNGEAAPEPELVERVGKILRYARASLRPMIEAQLQKLRPINKGRTRLTQWAQAQKASNHANTRWSMEELRNIAALSTKTWDELADTPQWLISEAAAAPQITRGGSECWTANAAKAAAGVQLRKWSLCAASAIAIQSANHWRWDTRRPPLQAIWTCATEGEVIKGHTLTGAALRAESRAQAREGPRSCKDILADAESVDAEIKQVVEQRAAQWMTRNYDGDATRAQRVLEALKMRWSQIAALRTTTQKNRITLHHTVCRPLGWRIPYTNATRFIAGMTTSVEARRELVKDDGTQRHPNISEAARGHWTKHTAMVLDMHGERGMGTVRRGAKYKVDEDGTRKAISEMFWTESQRE